MDFIYKKKKYLLFSMVIFFMAINYPALAVESIDAHKKVISPVEYFWIGGQARFSARIDSGAKSTSIHAADIKVKDAAHSMEDDVGKEVSFILINEEDEQWPMTRRISSVSKIRNSQGVELRYNIPLRIGWNGINKTVDVNLRDRSKMKYKLLVGRDWMKKEVVIDLEQ